MGILAIMDKYDFPLTVGLLAYNEEANIHAVIEETLAFCKERLSDWEVVIVDDGSTDHTAALAKEMCDKEPNLRLISHGENRGMGAGIRTVIENATKRLFTFNAADGQIPADQLAKLLDRAHEADIVSSTYSNRRETWLREGISRGLRTYLKALGGIDFELQGLYLFPSGPAKVIAPLIEAQTFYFSFDLIRRGRERGMSLVTAQIACRPRQTGRSKVLRPRRIVSVAAEAARSSSHRWFFFGIDSSKSRF